MLGYRTYLIAGAYAIVSNLLQVKKNLHYLDSQPFHIIRFFHLLVCRSYFAKSYLEFHGRVQHWISWDGISLCEFNLRFLFNPNISTLTFHAHCELRRNQSLEWFKHLDFHEDSACLQCCQEILRHRKDNESRVRWCLDYHGIDHDGYVLSVFPCYDRSKHGVNYRRNRTYWTSYTYIFRDRLNYSTENQHSCICFKKASPAIYW